MATDTGEGRARLVSVFVLAVGAICLVAWTFAIHQTLNAPGYQGEAVDVDFSVFWAAGKLALEGDWLAPFSSETLNSARALPPQNAGSEMLWLYPPSFHVLVLPFGALPFFWAWLAFAMISLVAFAIALRWAAQPLPLGWALVLVSPVVLMLFALGQNSLLMAALLIGALEAMRRERFWLAGLLIACMTVKPQLGVAIPFALVAGGCWRVILSASLATAAIVAATMIFPGIAYWDAFFTAMAEGSEKIRGDELEHLVITPFGNARVLGFDPDLALILHSALGLGVLAALVWIWRDMRAAFDIKAAALCFAVLLVTPYAIHYELVFALLGGLYLARAGFGVELWERMVLAAIWALPLIGFALAPSPGFFFSGAVLIAMMGLCLRRVAAPGRARLT